MDKSYLFYMVHPATGVLLYQSYQDMPAFDSNNVGVLLAFYQSSKFWMLVELTFFWIGYEKDMEVKTLTTTNGVIAMT